MSKSGIIYQDSSIGIIIRDCPSIDTPTYLAEHSLYPIRLQRNGDTEFRLLDAPKKIHPWQHKSIIKILKQIGYDVEIRIPKMKAARQIYRMTNKKQKFQFLLKYGRYSDK